MKTSSFGLCLVLTASCAHVEDESMTAADHRNEAQLLTAEAATERSKYDERDTRVISAHGAFGDAADGWNQQPYNPTASHLETADRDLREAAAHLKAARRLESFENERCRNIAPEVRSACPLLASSVREVTETKEGVRLAFNGGVDVTATFQRLDCHLAYAITQGFEQPSCPLFVKGMSLTLEPGAGGVIVLSAKDASVAAAIREQSRRVFLSGQPVSMR